MDIINICVVFNELGTRFDISFQIPKGRSALVAVQKIRDRFFPGHIEAEFVCVCDIRKESPSVIQASISICAIIRYFHCNLIVNCNFRN